MKIQLDLTEDQRTQLKGLLLGRMTENKILQPTYLDWQAENAFLRRMVEKLAKAKTSAT